MLIDLIRQALVEGTNLSPEEAAARVAMIIERREYARGGDDDLTTVSAGSYGQLGMLFSMLPEHLVLQSVVIEAETHDPEVEAWIEVLGEALIDAAVLPDHLVLVADAWDSAPPDVQLSMARYVVANIRLLTTLPAPEDSAEDEDEPEEVEDTEEQPDESTENIRISLALPPADETPAPVVTADFTWLDHVLKPYAIEQSLPTRFAGLGEGVHHPNCLGVAMILAAFAKRTGAPFLLSSMFRHLAADIQAAHDNMGARMREQYRRMVPAEDTDIGMNYRKRSANAARSSQQLDDFHYSVALRTSDGRWVHIDPYMTNAGLFTDDWELDEKYRLLAKYAPVLPGLAIAGDDGGNLDRQLAIWSERVDEACRMAESLDNQRIEVPAQPANVIAMADHITSSFYDHNIFGYHHMFEDSEFGLWLGDLLMGEDFVNSESLIRDFFFNVFYRFSELDDDGLSQAEYSDRVRLRYDSMSELFLHDDEFRAQHFKFIAGLPLNLTDQLWLRWWRIARERHRFVHATMEFSLPGYGLAIALLNQYRCWTETGLADTVLLRLGSSPMLWHEALDLSRCELPTDPELLQREGLIRQMPILHPRVAHKLRALDNRRAQGED